MAAIRARGEKLPSEVFSSMMRCICGVEFDSWKPDESYDHRGLQPSSKKSIGEDEIP
jgi:hypothetical protein